MQKFTTTNLRLPDPRRWYDVSPPVAATIVIFCLIGIAALVGKIHTARAVAVQPTPALVIVYATPLPPAPTPAAVVAAVQPGNVTQRAIVVYGDHDLTTAIGAVEAGRAFVPVARYGADWTQVDMSGGTGRVFVKTADLYGVPELVDLQPSPVPQVVYQVVNQPVYVEAAPTPAPEQYQITSALPTMAPQQLVILDRQAWAMQRAGR